MGLFERNGTVVQTGGAMTPVNAHRTSLEGFAVELCSSLIARTFSGSRFITENKEWEYILNVKPNPNESGTEFWKKAIKRLYTKGELLIVKTNTDQLHVARTWVPELRATQPNIYRNVMIDNDFMFDRTFTEDEVLHIELREGGDWRTLRATLRDYEEMASQAKTAVNIANQLRFKVVYPQGGLKQKDASVANHVAQAWVDAIENSPVVAIAESATVKYEEIASPTSTDSFFDSYESALWGYIEKVATAFGIPPVLLNGEKSVIDAPLELFYNNVIAPLNRLVEEELNAKIFTPDEVKSGSRIDIMGADTPNIFDLADKVDKLVSSGAFTRNEVRKQLGYSPIDGLDEIVITKNLQKGEEDEEILEPGNADDD